MKHLLISFLIALLSGMGVGGGGLMVIYLTLICRIPQQTAQGMNLLFFLFSALGAVAVHAMHRRIYGRIVLGMTLFSVLGSVGGALLSTVLPTHLLRKLFGLMLLITGVAALMKNKRQ